jgi:hypothetical protein
MTIDLHRKRKIYKILSLVFVIIDMLLFCTMESLDIAFSEESERYSQKLVIFVIKVIPANQANCYFIIYSISYFNDIP